MNKIQNNMGVILFSPETGVHVHLPKSPNRDDFDQNLSLVVKKDIFEILTKLFEIDFDNALL